MTAEAEAGGEGGGHKSGDTQGPQRGGDAGIALLRSLGKEAVLPGPGFGASASGPGGPFWLL